MYEIIERASQVELFWLQLAMALVLVAVFLKTCYEVLEFLDRKKMENGRTIFHLLLWVIVLVVTVSVITDIKVEIDKQKNNITEERKQWRKD